MGDRSTRWYLREDHESIVVDAPAETGNAVFIPSGSDSLRSSDDVYGSFVLEPHERLALRTLGGFREDEERFGPSSAAGGSFPQVVWCTASGPGHRLATSASKRSSAPSSHRSTRLATSTSAMPLCCATSSRSLSLARASRAGSTSTTTGAISNSAWCGERRIVSTRSCGRASPVGSIQTRSGFSSSTAPSAATKPSGAVQHTQPPGMLVIL